MAAHYRVKVPGKLLIAGDYAILEPGNAGIVVAVDRYVTLEIQEAKEYGLTQEAWSIKDLSWSWQEGQVAWQGDQTRELIHKLTYVKNALEVVHSYLIGREVPVRPYAITIHSGLVDESTGIKYGLGSSGAVVVGIICGVMALCTKNELPIDRQDLFKLAMIAHYRTQGNGSGVDIAASVYGGWLHFVSVDKTWLKEELARDPSLNSMVNRPWPRLKMVPLIAPSSLEVLVGWTGKAVATGPMVEKYQENCRKDLDDYHRQQAAIGHIMTKLLAGFQRGDGGEVLKWTNKHRQWLQGLDQDGHIGIESPELKRICDIAARYGAGKTSGAGGGDCGIGLVTSKEAKKQLIEAWHQAGLVRLDLGIASGVAVTRAFG